MAESRLPIAILGAGLCSQSPGAKAAILSERCSQAEGRMARIEAGSCAGADFAGLEAMEAAGTSS